MNAEMHEFCRWLHQDCYLYGQTGEGIVAHVLKIIGPTKSLNLNKYLSALLSNELTDHELAAMWEQSPADVFFKENDAYRPFLQIVCDMAGRYAQEHLSAHR